MSVVREKYANPLTDFGVKKLFEATEIAKFTPEEKEAYEESLKYYRDLKNVVDTSKEEGKIEGKMEVALALKRKNIPIEIIIESTSLTKEQIEEL